MRAVMLTMGSLLLAGLLIGIVIVFFGAFNVSARAGHSAIVDWTLHTTYRNSVKLRAPSAAQVPALDDADLVALGARHYQQACAACHGEPGVAQTRTILSMVPAPPRISEAIRQWQPNHLFWIIKHGVKMSGMPHWPALARDDDIWPVVAFLQRLPELDAERYARLLEGSTRPDTPPQSLQSPDEISVADFHECTLCHGTTGISDNDHVPRLDTLSKEYLSATLKAYRSQKRSSGIMQHATSVLDDESIAALARHYASTTMKTVSPAAVTSSADALGDVALPTQERATDPGTTSSVERGRLLATGQSAIETDLLTKRRVADVPACNACHGPWPVVLSTHYPVIASQPEPFLLTQLQLWKAGTRGGTELARLMHDVVPELDPQQMQDLAAYYARLPVSHVVKPDIEP